VPAQLELPDRKDQQVLPDQKVTLAQLVRKVLREMQELQGHSILIMEHLPLEV
jgi:hypothetical protein